MKKVIFPLSFLVFLFSCSALIITITIPPGIINDSGPIPCYKAKVEIPASIEKLATETQDCTIEKIKLEGDIVNTKAKGEGSDCLVELYIADKRKERKIKIIDQLKVAVGETSHFVMKDEDALALPNVLTPEEPFVIIIQIEPLGKVDLTNYSEIEVKNICGVIVARKDI